MEVIVFDGFLYEYLCDPGKPQKMDWTDIFNIYLQLSNLQHFSSTKYLKFKWLLSHLPLFCYTIIRPTSFTQFMTNISASLTSLDNFCCFFFFFFHKKAFFLPPNLVSFLFPLQSLAHKAGGIRSANAAIFFELL